MRYFLLAGVLVLSATATSAAQTQAALSTKPLTVRFVDARLGDVLTFIARTAEVTIEFDANVTEEMQRAPLSDPTLMMRDVTIEEALSLITLRNGLTYTVIGPKAIRVSTKP